MTTSQIQSGSPNLSSGKYRPDIDGLRLVAVAGVIAFHFGLPLSGGFVGVDIFFVISGYLISRIIVDELDAGRFSFRNFYIRRVRRIFPALAFTIVATLVASYLVFPTPLLQDAGISAWAAVFSVSNFYFWSQAGYFDTEAILKPLLHTWSLSVEEQFYFVWPLLLFWLSKVGRSTLVMVLTAIASLSFVGSVLTSVWEPNAAFYFTPFRAFEFAIGAAVLGVERRCHLAMVWENAISVIAAIAILLTFLFLDEHDPFPGWSVLPTVLATAALIFSRGAMVNSYLLSNAISVWGGRISYSLYLAHWPIFVLYSFWRGTSLAMWEVVFLIVATTAIAAAMYYWIETPFRHAKTSPKFIAVSKLLKLNAGAALATLLFGAAAAFGLGSSWQLAPEVRSMIDGLRDARSVSWQYVRGAGAPGLEHYSDGNGQKVLVIGDSHSKSFFNAVYLNAGDLPEIELRRFGFRDQCFFVLSWPVGQTGADAEERECQQEAEQFLASDLLTNADLVVVATSWNESALDHIPALKDIVRENGSELRIVTRGEFFPDIGEMLYRTGSVERTQVAMNDGRSNVPEWVNSSLKQLAGRLDIEVLDLHAIVCGDDGMCPVIEDGQPLYYDGHHWSLFGAEYFGQIMLENGRLQSFLSMD